MRYRNVSHVLPGSQLCESIHQFRRIIIFRLSKLLMPAISWLPYGHKDIQMNDKSGRHQQNKAIRCIKNSGMNHDRNETKIIAENENNGPHALIRSLGSHSSTHTHKIAAAMAHRAC